MAYNREDKWAGKGLSYSKSSQQHELKCLVDIKNETAGECGQNLGLF